MEGSEKKLLEISQIFFSLQSPVDTESPPLKTETPDIEVKDEIEEKLEAMEKGIEEPSEKVEVGEDEGKVKEDFNAADAALSASEYTADEKVRVEYIPQGKQMLFQMYRCTGCTNKCCVEPFLNLKFAKLEF